MESTTRATVRRWAAGAMLIVLVVGTAAMRGADDTGDGRPFVSPETVEVALEQTVPDRPTMSDAIDHYRARLVQRPGEVFSRTRLVHLHLLAHRAYGDAAHLREAERLQRDLAREAGPATPELLGSMAKLHLTRHDFTDALAVAQAADGAGGEAPWALFDALWAVGRHDEAKAVLDRPHDPRSTAFLSRRARALDADGYVEVARDVFRDVVSNVEAYAEPAPVRAWALVELGHFELHSGSPENAVLRYREAMTVVPGSPAALEGLASVALGVDGDLEAASRLLGRALEHGAHLDVMPLLAEVEAELGNDREARRLRDDFIERATTGPDQDMHRRPLVFVLADDPSTADRAVALAREDLGEREDPGAFDALAWALYQTGETGMAAVLSERALLGWSAPPPMLYRAGIIAAANGEHERAHDLLHEALEGAVELTPAERRTARTALEHVD